MKKQLLKSLVVFLFTLFTLILAAPVLAATPGDLNSDGRIDVNDVVLAMRHVLNLEILSEGQSFLADINSDNRVDVQDVSQLMQKSLGLLKEFAKAPRPETGLVDDFVVGEGLSPGVKMIALTLTVNNPAEYLVLVGSEMLYYNEDLKGFLGEVPEGSALAENVTVYKK